MNEFPLSPPSKDPEQPAEKKERVVDLPTPTLPDKVRIRPPKEEDDDSENDQDLNEGHSRGEIKGFSIGAALAALLAGLGGGS